MPSITVTMPALHASQREIAFDPVRFRVLAMGRRWGKTRLGAALCVEQAINGGRAWWVAPSYKMARVGWRLVGRLAKQIPGATVRAGDMIISLPTGGEIAIRSADNPDSLRGEGLDFCVLDECAFMRESAWIESIRPALSDRLGRAMFISTPKGRNWFWRLFQAAHSDDDIKAWQLPTADNPYIVDSEIEAARASLPERVFRQEYLAEFLDDAGGVFRGVLQAVGADIVSAAQPGRQYVIGVDVAQSVDYTVATVLDVESGHVVNIDRFNRVAYPALVDRLHALWERFDRCPMIVEQNSIGRPVIDMMWTRGMSVQPFVTGNASKTQIIQALQSAFEHGVIRIPDNPILIGELQAYEGVRLTAGMKYSAPDGMHDDCVMSLAFAWHGAHHSRGIFL